MLRGFRKYRPTASAVRTCFFSLGLTSSSSPELEHGAKTEALQDMHYQLPAFQIIIVTAGERIDDVPMENSPQLNLTANFLTVCIFSVTREL